MSTTGEQVQVTSELLTDLEAKAREVVGAWPIAWEWGCLTDEAEASFIAATSPSTVLALIQRIRELESTNSDLWKMIDRIPLDCPNH